MDARRTTNGDLVQRIGQDAGHQGGNPQSDREDLGCLQYHLGNVREDFRIELVDGLIDVLHVLMGDGGKRFPAARLREQGKHLRDHHPGLEILDKIFPHLEESRIAEVLGQPDDGRLAGPAPFFYFDDGKKRRLLQMLQEKISHLALVLRQTGILLPNERFQIREAPPLLHVCALRTRHGLFHEQHALRIDE